MMEFKFESQRIKPAKTLSSYKPIWVLAAENNQKARTIRVNGKVIKQG